ncbi:MAG: aminotransferase class I/II-fold pyridoxal phosphate-dependent enzyme [Spirochaetaceae bacterium]|jgi:threonine-phosphate decarboxylase|nr:aminotransferase class I/II-fold pyridoxal phosphate-dependent enzyme [Spirochaetaceae bacterium]
MYHEHGGDLYFPRQTPGPGFPGAGRTGLRDFSANISPLGLPRGVLKALAGGIRDFDRYPDPRCGELREALAEHHGLGADRIVCGNGAADLIYRMVHWIKPKRALVLAPSFSEYEKALKETGCTVERYELAYPRFQVDEKILALIRPGLDLMFFCNPNNPTGILAGPALVQRISQKCAAAGVLLAADECFNELLDDPGAHTLRGDLPRTPRLVILKAFTKLYAMAGLRLGYILCGSAEIARDIAGTGPPWSVSAAAQRAGIAALRETAYVENLRRMVKTERNRMKALLADLGLEVLGGEANYLFFRFPGAAALEGGGFFQSLLDRGILIRNCGNYPGLDDSYYRIAIKKPAENRALIRALRDIQREAPWQKPS